MRTLTRHRTDLPKTYDRLVAMLPPRPVHDEVDLDNVLEVIDRLAVLRKRTHDQEDYLEALSVFAEKYEDEHEPIRTDDLDPIELLKSLMQHREMSASDLGRLLGQRELGQKILTGKRQLSKAHILKLAKHFAVSPAVFLASE